MPCSKECSTRPHPPQSLDISSPVIAAKILISSVDVDVCFDRLASKVIIVEVGVRIAVALGSEEDARMEIGDTDTGKARLIILDLTKWSRGRPSMLSN